MPWDGKGFLGYVETIQLILGVTDKWYYEELQTCATSKAEPNPEAL